MPWILDGVGLPAGIGDYMARYIQAHGDADRLAKFGKTLWQGTHDFGPGVGVKWFAVFEKWIGVDLGGKPPWDTQGVAVTSPHFAAILQEHYTNHH